MVPCLLSYQRSHGTENRYKGELLLAREVKSQKSEILDPKFQILDPQSEVEACFLKAIEIARKQQAKSLELRAVMKLRSTTTPASNA